MRPGSWLSRTMLIVSTPRQRGVNGFPRAKRDVEKVRETKDNAPLFKAVQHKQSSPAQLDFR